MNISEISPACGGALIPLGRQGENGATQIAFDLQPFLEKYGAGSALLLHQRSKDKQPYPVAAVQDGDKLVWTVSSEDTAFPGVGKTEIQWHVGDQLAKSQIYTTRVIKALEKPTSEQPEPVKNWLDNLMEWLSNAKAFLDNLMGKLERGELNGKDGVDGAPGRDGAKGDTGERGADGFSPTVSIASISGGHRITVSDKDGSRSVDVLDGAGGVMDVSIDGKSIVTDGTAAVPVAHPAYSASKVYGAVAPYAESFAELNGLLTIKNPTAANISDRAARIAVTASTLDDSVKAAMCDGKGAAWTPEEQKAAQERMGILSSEEVLF